jgi:hypothetical protein
LPGYQYGLGGMFEAVEQMKRGHLERAFCFCLGGHLTGIGVTVTVC